MALPISGASQAVPSTLADNTIYMIKDQLNKATFPAGSLAAAQQLAGPAPAIEPTGPTLTELSWATFPTKMEYLVGEPVEWSGASFRAVYSDGSKKLVSPGAAGLSLSPAEGTITTDDAPLKVAATYTDGWKSLSCNTWFEIKTTIITTDPDHFLVLVGNTATFTVTIRTVNTNTSKDFTVSVKDETVATASASGNTVTITGMNPGDTTIIVSTDNNRELALVDVIVQ